MPLFFSKSVLLGEITLDKSLTGKVCFCRPLSFCEETCSFYSVSFWRGVLFSSSFILRSAIDEGSFPVNPMQAGRRSFAVAQDDTFPPLSS